MRFLFFGRVRSGWKCSYVYWLFIGLWGNLSLVDFDAKAVVNGMLVRYDLGTK